jgi:hypothetical protein
MGRATRDARSPHVPASPGSWTLEDMPTAQKPIQGVTILQLTEKMDRYGRFLVRVSNMVSTRQG